MRPIALARWVVRAASDIPNRSSPSTSAPSPIDVVQAGKAVEQGRLAEPDGPMTAAISLRRTVRSRSASAVTRTSPVW
jgi:hypothetical protein